MKMPYYSKAHQEYWFGNADAVQAVHYESQQVSILKQKFFCNKINILNALSSVGIIQSIKIFFFRK